MINDIIVEVCCGGIDDVINASSCNIDRIELNSALELGGLTPSLSVLKKARKVTDKPICCMARCRTAGFNYTAEEFEIIMDDSALMLENGADGIVFGFLKEDGTVDKERTRRMVELIHPKQAVFHKAFDDTPDKRQAIIDLIDCGVDRILTSGGASYPDVFSGLELLRELNEEFGDKIQILFGGGVRKNNAKDILRLSGLKQIHMTAKQMKEDPEGGSTYVAVSKDNLKSILSEIADI